MNGTRSSSKNLPIGCVQGSTLGPRLFTNYCGGLKSMLNVDHFVCYTDDSYVVITDSDLENAKRRVNETSKWHTEELKKLGMKVNVDKTDVVVFSKNKEVNRTSYSI